jgi:ribosomal protein S18 acetylase RimI-like enzyme
MTIKRAGLEDLDSLAILFDAYRRFYKQPSDLIRAKIFLEERLRKSESVIFIATDADKAIGFTQLYPIFSSVSLKSAWLLNDLYVEAGVRKSGAGTQLLEAAKTFGRETHAAWLLLETAVDNLAAQALYEKNGWKKTEDLFYQFDL